MSKPTREAFPSGESLRATRWESNKLTKGECSRWQKRQTKRYPSLVVVCVGKPGNSPKRLVVTTGYAMIATRMCCFLMPAIAVGAITIATRSVPITIMRVILVPGKPAKPATLSADEVCGMREGDYSCSWRLQHYAQQGICLRGLFFKGIL